MRIIQLASLMIGFFFASATFAQNEKVPPDYFKAPGGGGKYLFPTKLEKPCTARAGFCPNYGGTDGMPENWVLARYKSRHAGGFDSGTSSLLMVYMPAGAIVNGQADTTHRWLNFALPKDVGDAVGLPTPRQPIPETYDSSMPRTFTMVSLTEGNPAKIHFQKFRRNSSASYYEPESVSAVTGCYGCHPNGLRAISPLGYHVNTEESADPTRMLETDNWKAVKAINDAMVKAGGNSVVQWEQGFDPTRLTQILGASDRYDARTKEFILGTSDAETCKPTNAEFTSGTRDCGCARAKEYYKITDIFGRPPGRNNIYNLDRTATLDWELIRDAMDCESCHDHSTRGAITTSIGAAQVDFKILVDQSMPDGFHGNPEEGGFFDDLDINHRIAIANCLHKEVGR